jgi:hypothetical protein
VRRTGATPSAIARARRRHPAGARICVEDGDRRMRAQAAAVSTFHTIHGHRTLSWRERVVRKLALEGVLVSPKPVLERRSGRLGRRVPLVLLEATWSPSTLEAVAVATSSAILVVDSGCAHASAGRWRV